MGTKIPQEIVYDDRLMVPQRSPSKTAEGWRDSPERSEWNDDGIRQSSAPTPGASIAVSPMRPSRKRVSSAGHGSDTEPGSALPGEWEKKQCWITEPHRASEVRGGGKEEARGMGDGEKPRTMLQPSRKKNGVPSSSLTLTKRLKAKAVRESPRVRKLRGKLAGRVGAGGGTCFPENTGASRTASVTMTEGDRSSSGEVTGRAMPYSGDNVSFVSSLPGWNASADI